MARAFICFFLLTLGSLSAAGPVYVVLWFDTEDYIEPASDDAALRIAKDLTAEGVQATFKVVGEKARVLEKPRTPRRHRGAFASTPSGITPTGTASIPRPSEYLRHARVSRGRRRVRAARGGRGRRREADFRNPAGLLRAAGKLVGTAKQPRRSASSESRYIWTRATRSGVDEQPFWYGGLLYVFRMGKNQFRAQLNVGAEDPAAYTALRRSGRAARRGWRRNDQHLLPPQRVRHHRVLGRREFRARRQSRAGRVGKAEAADGRGIRAVLWRAAPVRAAYEEPAGSPVRDRPGSAGHLRELPRRSRSIAKRRRPT